MLDSMGWRRWRHITKLDPDKEHNRQLIAGVLASGTDAIVLGGTQGITREKVGSLLGLVRETVGNKVPVLIEISSQDGFVPGADAYLVPVVLNTNDPYWLVGAHREMMERMGHMLDIPGIKANIIAEGYIVLNPHSAVAQKTSIYHPSPSQVIALARVAEHVFNLPVVYLEYSGTFGDPALVKQVKTVLNKTRLFYGGGISCPAQSAVMGTSAHTVVVGNIVYTAGAGVLREIRLAVEETEE